MRVLGVIAAVVLVACTGGSANAQTLVVAPNFYQSIEGPGGSNTLVRNQGNPRTMQIIYDSSQLTDLVNHEITSIAYRLTNSLPGSYPLFPTTWSEYHIEIGPCVDVLNSTTIFGDNYLSAPQMVRSGSLTVPALAWPVGSPPNPSPWGFEIVFDTPYRYTGGDLALLITHPGSDNPDQGNSLLDATNAQSPGVGTLYTAYSATSAFALAGTVTPFVPIIRLQGRPIAIPEPAACVPLALTSAWFLARHRRRKTFERWAFKILESNVVAK